MQQASPTDLGLSQAFAAELIDTMTTAEKAGQLAQVEKDSITPDEVAAFAIGSVLSGCGGNPDPNTPENWRRMVDGYLDGAKRSRLGIPLLYGTDSVHGHGNVFGATIFPHNIGLGAAGDPELTARTHRATAIETAATGARWAFAPTVAVGLDPRWGRTYESFGDTTIRVSEHGRAAVTGLQGHRLSEPDAVLACLKHYVGDGGTRWGSAQAQDWIDWWDGWGERWQIDQGDTRIDEADLRAVHLPPYRHGLDAGALTVMASYSSWNGDKLHGNRYLLTEVLKGELGFAGFVVSDWLGVAQLDPDPYRSAVLAIEAGVDMVMLPFDFRRFITDVTTAVEVGDLDRDRVDDAVRRVLTVKHALGLFGTESARRPAIELVGCADHRSLAREAVAASAVLLVDHDAVLPVEGGAVLVAGVGADDIGLQCGGWTIEWAGNQGPITPGSTILDGLRESGLAGNVRYQPDAEFPPSVGAPTGIVVVAEPPYAEGAGDLADLTIPDDDAALIERLRTRVDRLILVIFSGRPLVLDPVIEQCDAVIAAWLPGSEGAGIADVITGKRPFQGRLPRRWPGQISWPTGHGVTE